MTYGEPNPKVVKNPNSVNECRRTIPRGLRTMIAIKRPLDDMPDAAIRWLQRHELIRPNKRASEPGQSTWTYTTTGRRLEGELVKEATRAA
ncbi:hypothetical protein HMPREF2692_06840 [Corynebacterium sp. HMSC036D03]|uniref:hypothetical protein n=1 Tax=Corynebacterium sp. HMSC036D03 TaxID=1715171 RepID=UPI0008A8C386|nr:hypothetical protein [Corynebacterium sp. HMSC036D03]OHO67072.1 hypothetical protein HMPREF2692_06840 [Corynebacterium sp. HMSC036D03]